jgi:enoyl-CoA hydratase/carnithine racemase
MSDGIEITASGGVQTLRLARPEKKNALTSAMYKALADALEAGDASDEIAVHVILGSGGTFSAGNDIGEFLLDATGGGNRLTDDALRFVRALPAVQKPIVAGVGGPAVGVGTTLLLHCDLVYATPDASFSTPFLDLGLVPEAASSLLLPQRAGYARAFEMLVLGEIFSAERAREAGLVNAVVSHANLEATVQSVAKRLAAKPPAALRTARKLMRGDTAAIQDRVDLEASAFRERLTSPEAQEAFAAFLEKRSPDFSKLRG